MPQRKKTKYIFIRPKARDRELMEVLNQEAERQDRTVNQLVMRTLREKFISEEAPTK